MRLFVFARMAPLGAVIGICLPPAAAHHRRTTVIAKSESRSTG